MTAEQSGRQQETVQEAVTRAFGAENRARLLARYFNAAGDVNTGNSWQHVYRLLLWIDRTTALAHCYESDKAQPGRAWYARSLAFHAWISDQLNTTPTSLGEKIDWLFREAVKDLANTSLAARTATYTTQRAPYEGRGFPEPGEDPELAGIIKESLGKWFQKQPPEEEYRTLIRRITVLHGSGKQAEKSCWRRFRGRNRCRGPSSPIFE